MADLTKEEIHYAIVKFRLLVHEADNQAYENLFIAVMTKRDPSIKPIKPQGTIGDKKNDGYSSKNGSYYQVYAPEKSDDKVPDAVEKAKGDFSGLKAYWDSIAPVKEYRFVFNDKFRGPYPT